ncbi:MAG: hypothetical protein ACD_11C00024G0007 [uncultured bacterium]|nr:MAG: hypothetical protein ACD_11C00024G0007 [uncultured bacterium]HBR72032.1 recombination protein RecR [Candidatus Moranbacteria bacterium]
MFPKSFQRLIKNFSSLPSIGPKHAERLVLFLFKKSQDDIEEFSRNLLEIKNLRFCQKCHNISEGELCQICADKKRDQKTICVVEEPLDIISIERTHAFSGIYHVLGGVITATEKDSALKIPDLFERVKKEEIHEIILATNPTTEGDTTALYLKKKLQPFGIKITRLGRGLSTGADLEYADELTLSEALTNRKELL